MARLLPSSRLVRTPVGFLWLGPDAEHTPVFDVAADDPADVPALRGLATDLAGASLAASVLPGEPAREAFAADHSFRLAATNMRLDVTGDLPGEELADRAQVTPMTDDEVAAYGHGSVATYARSREEAGESPELARSTAEASFAEMLPGGRPGEGHHLFTVTTRAGEPAGILWVCARWTRAQGMSWLGLNVFGPNRQARALYERLGYVVEEEHHSRGH